MSTSKTKNSHQKRLLKYKIAKGKNYVRCCFCKKVILLSEATLEHKIPLAFGGSWGLNNLCLSCKSCNWDRGIAEFEEYQLWKRGYLKTKPITDINIMKRMKENGCLL